MNLRLNSSLSLFFVLRFLQLNKRNLIDYKKINSNAPVIMFGKLILYVKFIPVYPKLKINSNVTDQLFIQCLS